MFFQKIRRFRDFPMVEIFDSNDGAVANAANAEFKARVALAAIKDDKTSAPCTGGPALLY